MMVGDLGSVRTKKESIPERETPGEMVPNPLDP